MTIGEDLHEIDQNNQKIEKLEQDTAASKRQLHEQVEKMATQMAIQAYARIAATIRVVTGVR